MSIHLTNSKKSQTFHQCKSVELAKMEGVLLSQPVTIKQNIEARKKNISLFVDTKATVVRVLGDTGTGKTTTFMHHALLNDANSILVTTTNSAVTNGDESIRGILDQSGSSVEAMRCALVTFTEASRGWHGRLQDAMKGKNGVLVICNASFFAATFHYWFDKNFNIMVDEPDNRTNMAVSPNLIRCIHTLRQKMYRFQWPKFQNIPEESKLYANEAYYYALQRMYIGAGNSYEFDPDTDEKYNNMTDDQQMSEVMKHCNIIKGRMKPYHGRFYTASATFPEWANRALDVAGVKFATIRMEKPENPSVDVYFGHFDDAIKTCLADGNLDALLPMLEELALDRVLYLKKFLPKFLQNLVESERDIQIESASKILIGLPGMVEVTQLKKMLMTVINNDRNQYGNVVVMASYDRDNDKVLNRIRQIALHTIPVIIEIVPSHELQGINFKAMSMIVTPFRRCREDNGNQTILKIDLNSQDEITQAKGRAGRMGPRSVLYCGHEIYETLEENSPFDPENLPSLLTRCISQGLHMNELKRMDNIFKKATTHDLMSRMDDHFKNGIAVLENFDVDETVHYRLTTKGKLSNIFYDDTQWFLDIKDYLVRKNQMAYENLFLLLLWRQVSLMLNGKATLFKFPRVDGMGIKDFMAQARDFIGNYQPVTSQFNLVWYIVTAINRMSPHDLGALKRTATFQEGELGVYVTKAYLNPGTLRNCCNVALGQINDLIRSKLFPPFPDESSTVFDFNDFTVRKTMQDLADGKIQIAAKMGHLSGAGSDGIFIGADGSTYLVEHNLTHPSDNDYIMVVHSVVKPSMLDKKLALATSILPTSVLEQTELIAESLIKQGVDPAIARDIHLWLMSIKNGEPIECPVNMESSSIPRPNGFELGVRVDMFTLNLLKSIKNMQDMKASLTPEQLIDMERQFGKVSIEYAHELNSTGGDFVDVDLPSAKIDVAGYMQLAKFVSASNYKKAFQPDLDPKTAFCPYVVKVADHLSQGFHQAVLVASRYMPEDAKNYTSYQILHCGNVKNACCSVCRKATPGNLTIEAVQQPCKVREGETDLINIDNMILMVRHADCMPRNGSNRRCPQTGGWKYNIGCNNMEMVTSLVKPKSPEPTVDYDGYMWAMIGSLRDINRVLNTEHTSMSVQELPLGDMIVLYGAYQSALTDERVAKKAVEQASMRRAKQKADKEQKAQTKAIREKDVHRLKVKFSMSNK